MKRVFVILLTLAMLLSVCGVSAAGLSKIGSRSEEVRAVQQALKEKGYYNYTVDGIFGTRTRAAVINFQRDNGLNPDGIVDFKMWTLLTEIYTNIVKGLPAGYEGAAAELFPGYTLTPGMRNNDVKEFQTYLRVIGQNISQIPVIEATGYFGPETERAVMIFQRLYGLEPSGIVGAPTWDAAAREYNYIKFGTERTG